MLRTLLNGALLLAVLAPRLPAQIVRLQLADSSGRPVPAALVTILDADGAPLRVLVSDARGGLSMPAADTSPITLRVERPGFEPFTDRIVAPAAGKSGVVMVVAVRRSQPEVRGTSGECVVGTVFAPASGLWQDAALGLRIMALAEELAMLDVRGGRYVRVLDRGGKVQHGIVDQEAFARSTMPYPGPRLAQLPLTGFAATDSAGTLAYLVPTPALLSSASFLQVHCIDRIVVERSRRDQLGLGFRPAPDNKTAAVEGVLWLDRATVAPRSVEWEYRDPTGEVPRGARGLVAFGIGRDSLPQAVRWWVRVPGVFQTTAGGAGEQVTNVIESGAFVLGSNDRPVEDPDGVFAALGEVFSIDPILVAGERAQRLTTEAGTKHIPAEELLGAPSTDAWDIVRILRPNWIRRSESIGLSDASSAGGLSFVVYLDRMRLSCLMGDARPQGMRTMSLLYGQSVPGRSGEQCLSPQAALTSISAADVASIEYVPPIEAGAIYGMGHGYGVVVVHTRRK